MKKKSLCEYFYQAGLLTQKEIEDLLIEQKKSGMKFSSIAVHTGQIKQETIDFFLDYFFLKQENQNFLRYVQ